MWLLVVSWSFILSLAGSLSVCLSFQKFNVLAHFDTDLLLFIQLHYTLNLSLQIFKHFWLSSISPSSQHCNGINAKYCNCCSYKCWHSVYGLQFILFILYDFSCYILHLAASVVSSKVVGLSMELFFSLLLVFTSKVSISFIVVSSFSLLTLCIINVICYTFISYVCTCFKHF